MNKLKTVMIVISLQIASIFSQKSNLSYNIDLLLNSEDKMNIANDELSNKTLNLDQLEKKYLFLKKSYRFKEAGAIIEEINKSFATEIQAKSLLADWAYFTMDYQLAESLYKDLLKVNPLDIAALNGIARISLDYGKTELALEYLTEALKMDSTNTTSLLNYADAQLKSKNSKGYAESIDKALKIDPENSEALGAKGYYLCIYQRKNHDGASFLNKAIEINHYNQSAHHLLGRGYTPANYSEKPVFDQDLLIVDSLLKNNQFEKASEQIQKRYLKDSKNPEVLKLLAAVEFHLGNYHKCIAYSFDLLRIKPNFGLAHFYISSSLFKLKNEHNVLIKKFNKDFNQKTVPDEIPFLKDVFINYNQCDDDLKKIIRLSVLPFCGFLEALKISGATVYFMDFHHQLWNCPYLENTQGTRSVDLRLVDDLGGQGGYHMTSEKFQQSEVMHGRYNVAFHEFAHLIHWLFTPEQLKELKQLFISAKKGGYTLDWYADLNER